MSWRIEGLEIKERIDRSHWLHHQKGLYAETIDYMRLRGGPAGCLPGDHRGAGNCGKNSNE